MRRIAAMFVMLVAVFAFVLPAAGVAADGTGTVVTRLDAEGALAHDLALRAKGKGWTLAEAEADYRVGEALDVITSTLASQHPGVLVVAKRSAVPGGIPTLYIKGPADQFVLDLVANSTIKIDVADFQPYSLDELRARRDRVGDALLAMGFRDFGVGSNPTGGGVIPASVLPRSDAPASTTDVLSNMPADLRSSVEITFADLPGRDTTSFGGMLVTAGGAGACTSGWSVTQIGTGVTGVTTAGHCSGVDGIVHPGEGTHTFVFQAEHRGTYGDVEWHTTNVAEPDDFYASATIIADVISVEDVASMDLGEWVCQYGRFSDDRDCNLEIADTSFQCTIDGVPNDNLVRMNGKTSTFGDSGGGWSVGSVAYGSQKGWCVNQTYDTFSAASLYDEALGVTVRTN